MNRGSGEANTSAAIARMFGAIADRYDLMNRLMTLGLDLRWRRQAAEVAGLRPGDVALDVACGTGDLTFALAERVQPGGHVVGLDFVEGMLERAREKGARRALPVTFELGDALAIPYREGAFNAVASAFGLRNVADRGLSLSEMARVVRPGGRVVILELTLPSHALARRYMDDVIPRLGQFIARARNAYTYLPESVHTFPGPDELGRMMQAAGLRQVTYRLLNLGTVALHWGTKPGGTTAGS